MTAPSAHTTRSARAAETRQRILEAARRVLAEEGSDGFTTRRVAELAGISHGMVHYHFQDKRDLVLALIVHARRDWVEPLEELVDGPGSAEQRMRAVISWMAEPQTTDVMRVHQTLFVFALGDDLVRRRLAAEFARWRSPFAKLFAELADELGLASLDAQRVGEAFAAAADALVQEQSLDPDLPTERMLTELFDRIVGRDGASRGASRAKRSGRRAPAQPPRTKRR
ncbi:MAG: TetR/AcrR family transcriptional regulator [Candidatus Velamenicoccus archaeovorus]